MTHLIITRLAIKWRYRERADWNTWLKNSIRLMDTYCRPSLAKQTNQDFILISIVDKSVKPSQCGNLLQNEIILEAVPNEPVKTSIIKTVKRFIQDMPWLSSNVIITRLDRDDCMRRDFVANLKRYFRDGKEKYIDIQNCHTYNTMTGKIHKSEKYQKQFCSPFVSTYENPIKCIPYMYDHPSIPKHIKGSKVPDLFALQIIHGQNISNASNGIEDKIRLEEYY